MKHFPGRAIASSVVLALAAISSSLALTSEQAAEESRIVPCSELPNRTAEFDLCGKGKPEVSDRELDYMGDELKDLLRGVGRAD